MLATPDVEAELAKEPFGRSSGKIKGWLSSTRQLLVLLKAVGDAIIIGEKGQTTFPHTTNVALLRGSYRH
jgi:hypothetical protein